MKIFNIKKIALYKVRLIIALLVALLLILSVAGIYFYRNYSQKSDVYTLASAKCNKLDGELKIQCWYDQIEKVARSQGIDPAFALFAKVYANNEPLGCHWTSHLIGNEAYKQFITGNKFKITKATSYCGYGFYHGFMEPLLRRNPDPKLAISFCGEVDRQLGSEGQDNCYHGIGHGFSEDPPPKNTWGKPELMVKPGLTVCEQLLGNTKNKWEVCATGVFTVVAKFFEDNKYGVALDSKNPFAFCKVQAERYKTACYGEFAPKLDKILNWDPSKIPSLLTDVTDNYRKEIAIRGSIAAMLQKDILGSNLDKYILACRNYPEGFVNICFKGVVWGLIMHGTPQMEYQKVYAFCKSLSLTENEKNYCYKEATDRFKNLYDPTLFKQSCQSVEQKYKNLCNGSLVQNLL